MTSVDQYQVIPTEECGPVTQFVLKNRSLKGHLGVGLRQTGPPTSVLENAGRNAFWDFSLTVLKRLVATLGVQVEQPGNLVQHLAALIQKAVPGVTPGEISQLMAKRVTGGPQILSKEDLPEE
eukprot:5800704-Lingulodinium_polyedra.AAC.1